MYFLSIDLGETTGLVLYDLSAKRLVRTTTLKAEEDNWALFIDYLQRMHSKQNMIFVLEEMPHATDHVFNIYYALIISFDNTDLVKPAHWKPFARANKWNPGFESQHVRDAYNMLRYYLIFVEQADIGELA
jgi:hypothetical protein